MTPQSLIAECHQAGVSIRLVDGALKLKGAPEAVKAVADRLRPHSAATTQRKAFRWSRTT